MSSKAIWAFDLSKESTGACFTSMKDKILSFMALPSISIPSSSDYNKNYFLVKNRILYLIHDIMKKYQFIYEDTCIVLEHPIFGTQYSPLQYYLFQETLNLAYNLGIDVVCFSPAFLKSFIRQCVLNPIKLSGKRMLTKDDIFKIYKTFTYPLYPNMFPDPDQIKNSDMLDAFYLALLSSFLVMPYLDKVSEKALVLETTKHSSITDFDLSSILSHKILLSGDIYNFLFNKRTEIPSFEYTYSFHPKGGHPKLQFKKLYADATKNKHLSITSNFFYPFSKIKDINIILNIYRNKKGTESDLISFFTKKLKSKEPFIGPIIQAGHNLSFNKKGELFFIR